MPEPRGQVPSWMMPVMGVALLGNTILQRVVAFGQFVRFTNATCRGLASVRTWTRGDRLWRQLYFIGTTSVPVLAITGGFIGMILAFEGYRQFQSIGQETRLGGVINLSVVKQI